MAKAKEQGVPVTTRALIARINRELAKHGDMGEQLKKTRGGMQAFLDLGDYWILDIARNYVAYKFVDPEELGRELGVLKAWERVVD